MTRSADISPLSVLLSRVDAVSDGAPPRDSIACGFLSLDKILGGGFRRGDLVVLGGDVSSGKSALALAFAIRASLNGTRVAFLTAEMAVDRVLERIIAIEARAKIDDLRQGALDDETRAAAGSVAIRLRDHLPLIERVARNRGVEAVDDVVEDSPIADLVIVDSLSALVRDEKPGDDESAAVIRGLKELALERDVAVVVTAPVAIASRADRRPMLDDFGPSGAVKQTADVVLALYREDMYESSKDVAGATELLVRKNRNGPTGYVDLYFYAQWMRFEDMSE
jgi:replicative DNA helicase